MLRSVSCLSDLPSIASPIHCSVLYPCDQPVALFVHAMHKGNVVMGKTITSIMHNGEQK